MYYRFGAFLAPISVGIITGKHYTKNQTRETVSQQKQETITKQKNPLRVKQGKRLVEYNHRKKQELRNLNEQITKQDDIIERKPGELSNNYLYYMTNSYRPGLKKFDWFKAGL